MGDKSAIYISSSETRVQTSIEISLPQLTYFIICLKYNPNLTKWFRMYTFWYKNILKGKVHRHKLLVLFRQEIILN